MIANNFALGACLFKHIPRAGIGSGDGVLQTLQKGDQKLALGG